MGCDSRVIAWLTRGGIAAERAARAILPQAAINPLCVLSALASLGLPTSPWVVGALKGRLRVSAPLR